ncbi:hypothetical protein AAMO2058_000293900 [Amorphochlora amoebiformis]
MAPKPSNCPLMGVQGKRKSNCPIWLRQRDSYVKVSGVVQNISDEKSFWDNFPVGNAPNGRSGSRKTTEVQHIQCALSDIKISERITQECIRRNIEGMLSLFSLSLSLFTTSLFLSLFLFISLSLALPHERSLSV